jgi:hypothetical protein
MKCTDTALLHTANNYQWIQDYMVIVQGPAWQLLSFIYYVFTKHIRAWKVLKKMFYIIDIKYLTKTIYITKLCAWLQLFHDSAATCKSVPCYHPRFSLPKSVNIKKQIHVTRVMFLCYKCGSLKHQLHAESMHHVILSSLFCIITLSYSTVQNLSSVT